VDDLKVSRFKFRAKERGKPAFPTLRVPTVGNYSLESLSTED
jgi:hypothetical protein